jgi:hypothetical protein
MSTFSNIIFPFLIRKLLKNKAFFEKTTKKFQPPPPRTKKFPAAVANNEKKSKFLSRRRRLPKSFYQPPPIAEKFLPAAADEGIGLHLYLCHHQVAVKRVKKTSLSTLCIKKMVKYGL